MRKLLFLAFAFVGGVSAKAQDVTLMNWSCDPVTFYLYVQDLSAPNACTPVTSTYASVTLPAHAGSLDFNFYPWSPGGFTPLTWSSGYPVAPSDQLIQATTMNMTTLSSWTRTYTCGPKKSGGTITATCGTKATVGRFPFPVGGIQPQDVYVGP